MPAPTEDDLVLACETLTERDPALARAYALHGLPEWRTAPAKYHTLVRTVVFQLISLQAAEKIWGRLQDQFGGAAKITPKALLARHNEELRLTGLSGPKINHMKFIAEAILSGDLKLSRVLKSSAEDARRELTAVKGIGPWTADIFMLYSGVMDAFPAGDVGLMNAYKSLRGDKNRMDPKMFSSVAEIWRPYRGVAAHLLWAHFHALKAETV